MGGGGVIYFVRLRSFVGWAETRVLFILGVKVRHRTALDPVLFLDALAVPKQNAQTRRIVHPPNRRSTHENETAIESVAVAGAVVVAVLFLFFPLVVATSTTYTVVVVYYKYVPWCGAFEENVIYPSPSV